MNSKIHMVLAFIVCVASTPAFAGQAVDAIVIGSSTDDSLVTGTVTRQAGESLYVESMGREIEIKMDRLEVDNFRNLFQPGTVVTARGDMKDKGAAAVLRADEIVRVEDQQIQ